MLCPLCMSGVTVESYFSHLNAFHRGKKNVTLGCIIGGHVSCKTFNSVSALVRHYYKWHYKRPSLPASPPDTPPASPRASAFASPSVTPTVPPSVSPLPTPPASPFVSPPATPPGPKATSPRLLVSRPQPVPSSTSQRDGVSNAQSSRESVAPAASNATTRQEQAASDREDEGSEDDFEDVSDDESDQEGTTAFRKSFKEKEVDFSEVNTSAADLLLFLKSKCTVPQSAIDGVQEKCESLLKGQILKFVDLISPALSENNIDFNTILNVEKSVDSCSKVFTGINTKYKQDKYFEQKYEIVKPLRYFVGRDIRRKRRRKTGRRQNVLIENSLIFNRVTKFLEKLDNHPDFEKLTDPSLLAER